MGDKGESLACTVVRLNSECKNLETRVKELEWCLKVSIKNATERLEKLEQDYKDSLVYNPPREYRVGGTGSKIEDSLIRLENKLWKINKTLENWYEKEHVRS